MGHLAGLPGLVLAAACGIGAAAAQAAPMKYRVEHIGTLPGSTAQELINLSLNDAGTVVGSVAPHASGFNRIGSFVYRDGRLQPLQATGPWQEAYFADGVNNAGVAVGRYFETPRGPGHAVVYRGGQVIDVGLAPGGSRGDPGILINNAGTVVGHDDAGGFIWDGSTTRPLRIGPDGAPFRPEALNDRGLMGGWSGREALLFDGTRATPLPPLADRAGVTLQDLNDAGQLLLWGRVYDDRGVSASFQSYVWDAAAGYRALGPLNTHDADTRYAWALNDRGEVVGSMPMGFDRPGHAFVWRDGVLRDLNDLLRPGAGGSDGGWLLTQAVDVNNRGQIVGFGRLEGDPEGFTRGFLATPVPEGGTPALMLAGLALLGAWLRRPSLISAARSGCP